MSTNEADRIEELERILSGRPGTNGARAEAKGAAATTDADDIVELPEPGSDYQAHARASNKAVYVLHCILGKEGVRSFEYVQKDSNSQFRTGEQGQMIVLRFAGTKIWELTITGLSLWRLYDLIGQHRMAWIRKSDRGFSATPDKDPMIMGIDIKEIEREG